MSQMLFDVHKTQNGYIASFNKAELKKVPIPPSPISKEMLDIMLAMTQAQTGESWGEEGDDPKIEKARKKIDGILKSRSSSTPSHLNTIDEWHIVEETLIFKDISELPGIVTQIMTYYNEIEELKKEGRYIIQPVIRFAPFHQG